MGSSSGADTPGSVTQSVEASGGQRFGPTVTESDISNLQKAAVPANTKKNTNWAMNVWTEWASYRKAQIPAYLLTMQNNNTIHELISMYGVLTQPYTPHVSVWLSQYTIHHGMHTNELSSCAYTARGTRASVVQFELFVACPSFCLLLSVVTWTRLSAEPLSTASTMIQQNSQQNEYSIHTRHIYTPYYTCALGTTLHTSIVVHNTVATTTLSPHNN